MPSERVQRQIDHLLDEAEEAIGREDWAVVAARARSVIALDETNEDAKHYLSSAAHELGASPEGASLALPAKPIPTLEPASLEPTAFAGGRYTVSKFLGEGGKKKVYLAHDSLLDRDVAFALIKTEGLDDASRMRITREAQAMGRLGDHPNIVTVYDIGDENGAPYMVLPVLAGGDVEGVIEKAPEHRMPLERALQIAIETCKGLEFAHGRGIIHRDLKPGNVWLSEDGTAKIGDFGLAVAMDKSRLTQAGMMVGTVSYMPPEQAMGGEITPRSDLYSLGAMLYEMVCGRPPFVGDESVAIIGQHLNTPPVAPSWHRPDCPPALESLVLRLLEKDPSRRPVSATEVREALERVSSRHPEPVEGRVAVASAAAATDNPLYRRTFVGRENEVKQLQQAFDAALSGQGGLVMVVGEPGIGKTAICEQLATYVALRGGKALVGHCYEEGSLSLPYLAFVEAMRSYVLAREPDGLRSDLGTGAADVARIVSEVRDRVQGVELRPAGDPDDDRWRLLQAVTSFLRNASTVQPLCIVLEDLHWADRGTLDLLLHVSRNLAGSRLLLIGNYRDVEVDRSHPLSGALAELRRLASFQSLRLRGLSIDEVQRMMANIRGQEVPASRAEALHRQTEGNPLFVQEVLRYLVEEGLVVREDGRYVRTDGGPPEAGIPEGLRDVIGKRLSRLSPECNRLLAIASVIGRDFNLETLRAVAAVPEDDLVRAVEEATRIGVLEEQARTGAITYRFTHAFFRQTLYEELSAPRRLRMHQEVARVLEGQYSSRRQEHAAELAEHFANSTDRADLAKAVEYGELAAQRAMSVFDYGEAVRLLERTIDVQEVLDPEDKWRRCTLLLMLAQGLMPSGQSLRVVDSVASEALETAKSIGDRSLASRACQVALQAMGRAGFASSTPVVQEWARLADEYAGTDDLDRVYADAFLAVANSYVLGRRREAWNLAQGALELARSIGDPGAILSASAPITALAFNSSWEPARIDSIRSLITELMDGPLVGIDPYTSARLLLHMSVVLESFGESQRAQYAQHKLAEVASRTKDANIDYLMQWNQIRRAAFSGEFEQALEEGQRLNGDGVELWWTGAGLGGLLLVLWCMIRLGQAQQVLRAARRLVSDARDRKLENLMVPIAVLGLSLAHFGDRGEATAALADSMRFISPDDETSAEVLSLVLEAAVILGDQEVVSAIAPRLRPMSSGLVGRQWTAVGRLLGEASALLGRPDEAKAHFREALLVCNEISFRPELALTRLDLAELLLEQYPEERDAAVEHLDFAIAELRDMKMQPALERALRHRGLLKA